LGSLDRYDMMFDETQAKPLELLARYRLLCENAGASRATDVPLPTELQQQLTSVESELQTRLWMASPTGDGNGSAKPARGSRAKAASPQEDIIEMRPLEVESAPSPRAATAKLASTSSATATVFSDGACQGNPGPGGYGAIVKIPGQPNRELSGGKAHTTNNEMEMTAAIEGLKAAVAGGAKEITVTSDSEYLVKGMTGWIKGWLRNGWKTSSGSPVKNKALWEELHRLSQGRTVTWSWVRGHAGHRENERCDELAVAAAREAAGRK
jgi:ribonuclease HI